MNKIINFKNTVFDICKMDPEAIEILRDIGFKSITNPSMMNTAGRIMTIPKGAEMKGVELSFVKSVFMQKGYIVVE